jgi:DNA-binding protein HU-beta
MTKADLVQKISDRTGLDKKEVQKVVELFMEEIKNSLVNGENVYLRGFGSFITKYRAQKVARNISKNTSVIVPAHYIPAFKPSKMFVEKVKNNIKP